MTLPINQIIVGDCLEVMKGWPDGCVDLIVTDPPYGFNRFETDGKDYLETITPALREMARVLKPDGAAFVFTSTGEVLRVGKAVPLPFRRMLWMYKPADMTYPLQGWLLTSEAILWFTGSSGKCTLRERKPFRHDCYLPMKIGREGVEGHPTVKPLEVIKDLVLRCPRGGVVLDPFLGSGTTAVAAMEHQVDYIGIEIEPKYAEIARQRIAKEQAQGKLFT